MPIKFNPLLPLLCLAAILLAAAWAYAPGLHSGFLFDDYANLPALGATGPVTHWDSFWRYITSGTADPTGRPLTLLTFLLDAHDWPADPLPFKRTNLILHLLNGLLLYGLLVRLGQSLDITARRARTAALFGAAMWLLHPLFVSTTLYIVQREAMLPATCTLAGLLLWLRGRQQLVKGRPKTGAALSMLGLGGMTFLGVLAKANGALLPIYALLIDYFILSPRKPIPFDTTLRMHKVVMTLFGILPAIAIVAYLVWTGVHGMVTGGPVGNRSWSIGQRLLTEPRVVMDYLALLWLPRPFSSGLFNDQYLASTSWLHPATTLPALLALLALIGIAWRWRRPHPAFALAIFFFFAGQLLESTSIPLELYFEHRNYLPAMLMFWPLGLWLSDTSSLQGIKPALSIALPLMLVGMTHARAEVWGNVQTQAMVWARINPESPRAQANAAEVEMQQGHPLEAAQRLESLLGIYPDQVQLAFNLINARCLSNTLQPIDLVAAQTAMRHTRNPGALIEHWFERIMPIAMNGLCTNLSVNGLLSLIEAGLNNPSLRAPGPRQDLTYLQGRIALAQHHPDAALALFEQALDLQVRPGMALEAAANLGAVGYPSQALQMLEHYQRVQSQTPPPGIGMPMLHAWVLARQQYWPHEIAHLRQQLMRDSRAAALDSKTTNSHRGTAQ